MRCIPAMLCVIFISLAGCGHKNPNSTDGWNYPENANGRYYNTWQDIQECRASVPRERVNDTNAVSQHISICMQGKGYIPAGYTSEERSAIVTEYSSYFSSQDFLKAFIFSGMSIGADAWGAGMRGEDWPDFDK
ncbi:MAG TPA: hypothetical protein DDZ34_04790 [Syntrophaceae bacterium]|nr:hypothetical protein [Syntrophaceae bacterium]